MAKKLVQGVGVYTKGKFVSRVDGKLTKEYSLWADMLLRCYSSKFQARHPTYVGYTVSEGFKNFQYFAEWCHNQVGFGKEGYDLDKDLLCGSKFKEYSEQTCVFVPRCINLFSFRKALQKGSCPRGVSYYKASGRFVSQGKRINRNGFLGYFDTPEEAFYKYKESKERHAKELAFEYFDSVDERVILALSNYTVNIND